MATALIIDDNEMNLETIGLLLKKEGMTPVALNSPAHLEEQITELENIRVIFLDLEFPNHDGMCIVRDLKSMPELSNVPIIAYTVHISEQQDAREAGFDGFIGKPLNTKMFPEQLRRILSGEAVWDVGQ